VRALTPASLKDRLRPLVRRSELARARLWHAGALTAEPGWRQRRSDHWCNVCGWSGRSFDGEAHAESAVCPRCESIARDRFLFFCFLRSRPYRGARVLETSPRMGEPYRQMMARLFSYTASDYELANHRAGIKLDLQDIQLPDASFDVVLTPHVLEHVPDTDKALSELARVLTRSGRMYLQVPLEQGETATPSAPEYHGDDTLVHWRFGWDLTDRCRAAGFDTRILIPNEFSEFLLGNRAPNVADGGEFDLASLRRFVRPDDVESVLIASEAQRLGVQPSHQFAVWECVKGSSSAV
jgi:SAM-dependent methyltransferase